MKSNRISKLNRAIIWLAALSLLAVLVLPIWRIELDAPQYPEGLALQIHANDIKGDVDIINGLNHYIGMNTLHKEDFIEFTVLPYIIIGFSLSFAVVALLGRRKFLYAALALFILFGIVAMVDFWRWEYNYGHNLNPDAAIKVPGMAYQPPLIGFKQLLNFGAYSIPDTGGWIFIGAGLLMLLATFREIRSSRISSKTVVAMLAPLLFFLSSCTTKVDPIVVGKDACYFCKMGITDARYGAVLLTSKGRSFKFDDVSCLRDYLKSGVITPAEVKELYIVDFSGHHELMPVHSAKLFYSEALNSPMQGNVAAFANADSMQQLLQGNAGSWVAWEDVMKK